MSKLHEVLAVERDLENASKKVIVESMKTLNKENLFSGAIKQYKPFSEDDTHLATTEHLKLETTVDENLDYTTQVVAKHWDCVLQKDLANQEAVADLVVDGNVIASNLPATFLLGLETKLNSIRKLFEALPTLAPGIHWDRDEGNEKEGVFTTRNPIETIKTENVVQWKEISPATPQHPAQLKEVKAINNVGKYQMTKESGMLRPVDKAARLERIDVLLRAVKKARAQANCVAVGNETVGKALFDFING